MPLPIVALIAKFLRKPYSTRSRQWCSIDTEKEYLGICRKYIAICDRILATDSFMFVRQQRICYMDASTRKLDDFKRYSIFELICGMKIFPPELLTVCIVVCAKSEAVAVGMAGRGAKF
mmetsp:Transcript_14619/g.30966  ORF Transcript_14619/g.30966 Transcript_14619/m.30966 type:complete len:119 (-) Transcript_14619:422-778(-)